MKTFLVSVLEGLFICPPCYQNPLQFQLGQPCNCGWNVRVPSPIHTVTPYYLM